MRVRGEVTERERKIGSKGLTLDPPPPRDRLVEFSSVIEDQSSMLDCRSFILAYLRIGA